MRKYPKPPIANTYAGIKTDYKLEEFIEAIVCFIKSRGTKTTSLNTPGLKRYVRNQTGAGWESSADWERAWDEVGRKPNIQRCGKHNTGYQYVGSEAQSEECFKKLSKPSSRSKAGEAVKTVATLINMAVVTSKDGMEKAEDLRPQILQQAGLAAVQAYNFWGPISLYLKKNFGIICHNGYYVLQENVDKVPPAQKKQTGHEKPAHKTAPKILPGKSRGGKKQALATGIEITPPENSTITIVFADGSTVEYKPEKGVGDGHKVLKITISTAAVFLLLLVLPGLLHLV